MYFISRIKDSLKVIRGYFYRYDIKVLDNKDSVDLIKKYKKSVVRFGDGEFDLIRGKSIPYQKYNSKLAKDLWKIILQGSNEKLLVCLPDVFISLNRYTRTCQNFYYENFFYQNRKLLKRIQIKKHSYGSTFISRPYIDKRDKRGSREYFQRLKLLWENKDILIVEGKYTRSGEGNDLFNKARSINRIIAPANNAYSKLNEIEEAIRKYSNGKLVLLMLGPTAKIIVKDLYKDNNIDQLIDLGHIDSEYEWYKMGVTQKVKIPHKHTAEFNYDDNQVNLITDDNYEKQVVRVIK